MRMLRDAVWLAAACFVIAILRPAAAAESGTRVPDAIDFSMFFMADVRDSPECRVHASGRDVVFGDNVTNPAMTCPDAFAWKVFVETVASGFWENWSTNRQTWPSDPWPRCKPGEAAASCCPAVDISNTAWPEHCPVFPGPTAGVPDNQPTEPAVAQQISLATAAVGDKNGNGKPDWEDVPAALKNAVIGDLPGELVYRNEPMVDYIFDRELYSSDGLAKVFDNFTRTAGSYAPYWPARDDPGATPDATPALVSIEFPVKAVMVKANWLSVDDARTVGIDPYDQANPFIIMDLVPTANANKPPDGPVKKTPHILLSLHMSSRDLPDWFWATFEHVGNQGRCDWTGCNDSFGYIATAVPAIDGGGLAMPARNFTPPHRVAKVGGFDQSAFLLAERYLGEDSISPPLDEIFTAFGLATGSGINRSGRPTPQDFAWRSYRLKGSQTGFVTSAGRPVRLGNSVTEAGFVNTASCMTCHSRAGATRDGTPPLAIFEDMLSDLGLSQSVNGMPNEAWFNVNAYRNAAGEREALGVIAVQTDFVWGFRNACPIKPAIGPSWCKNATASK